MDSSQPLVSILMTAYNREKYISEAIESVLASTYTNFELIIVDDGSKDKTVEIVKVYEVKDNRVKLFMNKKNLGDYPNRNMAASYAKGKYIKYIDADDYIYPDGLNSVIKWMEQHPEADYGLDSIEQDIERPFPILLSPYEAYYRHYFQRPTFHKAPTSCIIKKEVFDSVGGFSGRRMVGDFEMWLKLSRKHSVLLMPMGIVWSRNHSEQEFKLALKNSVVHFDYSVVEVENLIHNNCPLSKHEKQQVLKSVRRSQARSILRSLLIEKNYSNFKEKLNLSKFNLPEVLKLSLSKKKV